MNDILPPDFLHHLLSAVIPVANVFGDLRDYMRDFLAWIESWTGNWGVAIIILTIIVRIVIFPLTWKQIRSQMAMQSLTPKIKEIQAKHKGDKQRIQQETMKLYQQYRINPLASCFPLLLQLPIFMLLYYAIRGYAPLEDAQFLWLTLGQPDPYYILLVVYVVSQLISTELMLTPETQTQQKWIMRAMPLIFVAFLWKFPSGLFVYWITTNLWTIGQTMIVRYVRTHHPVELKEVDTSKPQKRSRFMEAMQAAQDQRESGGASPGGRSRGKQGQRPAGKQGQRPAGKQGQRPAGKSGQRSPGKQGERPSGQRPPVKLGPDGKPIRRAPVKLGPDGKPIRRAPVKLGPDGKPIRRPAGSGPRPAPAAPDAQSSRSAGGPSGGASRSPGEGTGGQRRVKKKRPPDQPMQTSKTGKRPVKPKGPKPDSTDGS